MKGRGPTTPGRIVDAFTIASRTMLALLEDQSGGSPRLERSVAVRAAVRLGRLAADLLVVLARFREAGVNVPCSERGYTPLVTHFLPDWLSWLVRWRAEDRFPLGP